MTRAKNEGRKIINCDETMITRKTIKNTEWACKHDNMTVDEAKLKEPTLAVLAAISKEKGLEYCQIFPKSVDTAKFKEWLAGLRAENPEIPILLFMDNLGAHKCDESKKEMKRLKIRWCFNVRYSPQ